MELFYMVIGKLAPGKLPSENVPQRTGKLPPPPPPPPREIALNDIFCEIFLISSFSFYENFGL